MLCAEENDKTEAAEKDCPKEEEKANAHSSKNEDNSSEVIPAKEEESTEEKSAKSENEDKQSDKKPVGLNPQIENISETSITISWQSPQDDDTITAYRIICKPKEAEEDGGKEKLVDDAATMTTTFEDLNAGTEYIFEVVPLMGEEEGKRFSVEAQTSKNSYGISFYLKLHGTFSEFFFFHLYSHDLSFLLFKQKINTHFRRLA